MKLSEYERGARETAFYPKESALSYCALGLCGESGEVADKLKKVMRDGGGVLSEEVRLSLAKEVGDVLWYVANLSVELGFSLEEIALMNLEKLSSRQSRGVLSGEGDDR